MEGRKKDHIDLAFQSQTQKTTRDKRFDYEPMLSGHPEAIFKPFDFLGKVQKIPVWVSSMTGGTKLASRINANLARACQEFGMGMGLGSCRIILDDNTCFEDFNVREIISDEYPLYANLGIVQIEQLLEDKQINKVTVLVNKLRADGLIIHVNPLQEYLQPEGDRLKRPAIEIITEFISRVELRIIVKEVGQGMGPAT
jgi:isopentenyl-diphosphate delta-isomerase